MAHEERKHINVPHVNQFDDHRGSLLALNFPQLPFVCRRVFVVSDVPVGCTRGRHAHFKTEQVLVCLSGAISIVLDTVDERKTVMLRKGQSMLHGAMEWAEITFVEQHSVLLSACSTDFDPDDYIGDYQEFKGHVMQARAARQLADDDQHAVALSDGLALMPVPLLDLKKAYHAVKAEVDRAMQVVLDSAYYVNGPAVLEFEKAWALYTGSKHCVGLSNGTDAIVLALEALGIGAGDDVVLQGNAYICDAMVVDYVGARCVLVDQDDSYQLDLNLVEQAITPNTKAVLVVHMYGVSCDMERLVSMCKKHRLLLVEDCAHAHGATWNGKCLGTFGDIGCWSFYPGKNLGAYGDGGACTTNNALLDKSLRLLKNYGSNRKYFNDTKGRNYRLDTIQAAVLNVKINYLAQWNDRRRQVAAMYRRLLTGVGDIGFVRVPHGCVPVWHQFVVTTSKRDDLLSFLCDTHKIGAMMHYPVPIHRQLSFASDLGHYKASLPLSDSLCDELLSLPMDPMLSDDQVRHVVAVVKSFFKQNAVTSPLPPISERGTKAAPSALRVAEADGGIAARKDFKALAVERRMKLFQVPPLATVEAGADVPVRVLSHAVRDVHVGSDVTVVQPVNLYECYLADGVFVGPFVEVQASAWIGDRTRVQSHAFICEFVSIGTDCFIGHGAMFINDLMKGKSLARADREAKLLSTTIGNHVVVGTNATVLPVTICDYVVIGAGSVVTRDITESGTYAGNPAQRIGPFDYSR